MAYPITRQFGPNAKGSELTYADMDNNLLYLDAKVTGSNNYIALFSGSKYIINSILFQNNDRILTMGSLDISGSLTVTGSITGGSLNNALFLGSTFINGPLYIEGSGSLNIDAPISVIAGSQIQLGDVFLTDGETYLNINNPLLVGTTTLTGSLTGSNNTSFFGLVDATDAFVLHSEYNEVNQFRLDAYNSITYLQEVDGEVNIGYSTPQGRKLSVNGSTRLSGSVTITDVLTLPPVNPLPSGRPIGSLAVSGSGANCKIYFFNGSWNALF